MPVPTSRLQPTPPRLVTARVIADVAAAGDPLYVLIPSGGQQRSVVVGWPPKQSLPRRGDECLVAYDEHGDPWVAAWTGGGGGTSSGGAVFRFVTFTVLEASAANTILARAIPLIDGHEQEKLQVASVGAGLTQLNLPAGNVLVGDSGSDKLSYGRVVAAGTPATMTVYTFEAVAHLNGIGLSIVSES